MEKRRKFVRTGLLLSAGLMIAASAGVQAAQPVELAFSSWIPPTHVLMKDFMIPWGAQIEKATEGRVKVHFLPKPVTNPVGHRHAIFLCASFRTESSFRTPPVVSLSKVRPWAFSSSRSSA